MNSLKKGFIMWILVSTIFVSCSFAKSIPVKRRMVLRLPFVHNQENSQVNSFHHRTFLRMLNGNSKIKKASTNSENNVYGSEDDIEIARRIFMLHSII